jgi:hypothetical protein
LDASGGQAGACAVLIEGILLVCIEGLGLACVDGKDHALSAMCTDFLSAIEPLRRGTVGDLELEHRWGIRVAWIWHEPGINTSYHLYAWRIKGGLGDGMVLLHELELHYITTIRSDARRRVY